MDIYHFDFKKNQKFKHNSILLLGEFELFHKGHQKLLNKAREIKSNEKIGILIINNLDKKTIQSLDLRLENLAKIGFDFVILADFNFEFKSLDGKDFIRYLESNFNVNYFISGKDFYFGKDRKYSWKDLELMKPNKTFSIDLEMINQTKVSSSDIKQMYEFGELNLIKNLLVNPIRVDVEIINRILFIKNHIKPHFGIYYFRLLDNDYWYCGIIHFSIENTIQYQLLNHFDATKILDQKTQIEILDNCRIIASSRFDQIEQEDIARAKQYFSKSIA